MFNMTNHSVISSHMYQDYQKQNQKIVSVGENVKKLEWLMHFWVCLLYTSDAADETSTV